MHILEIFSSLVFPLVSLHFCIHQQPLTLQKAFVPCSY